MKRGNITEGTDSGCLQIGELYLRGEGMSDDDRSHPADGTAAAWLAGGGEMGERIRALDWASTPLGPTSTWPQSLRSAISILLPSKAQICLFWGPELVKLYNDAYIPVLGGKHARCSACPAVEVWSEIWDVLGPLLDGVIETGEAFRAYDHPFYLIRHGFAEETYFDVSYDPVRDETGRVGGVFCIVERDDRPRAERASAPHAARPGARQGEPVGGGGVPAWRWRALAPSRRGHPVREPVPPRYAGSAVAHAQRRRRRRRPRSAEPGRSSPSTTRRGRSPRSPSSGRPRVQDPLSAAAARELPDSAAPDRTLMLPAMRSGQCAGFMVAGTSRFLALGDDYRDFFDLVAAQIGTAVTQASSYEEERKRAEALAELDRAKTTFFSNISHEFRTPLTLMLGPLDDLLGRAPAALTPSDHDALAVIGKNGRRLLKLVNTLLDFSRIQAGRHEARYEPTDLGAFTADLAGVFRSAIEQAGSRFDVRCPSGLEPVYVDRAMWEKIVLNLLSNAFKFTFEGSITVELADRGPAVELVVRDTGIGIAPAELARVFDRFHRIENVRARTHEGSGIGLALVQELARLHGGDGASREHTGPREHLHGDAPPRPGAPAARSDRPRDHERDRLRPASGPSSRRRWAGCRARTTPSTCCRRRRSASRRPAVAASASWSPTTTPTCGNTSRACSVSTGRSMRSATATPRWRPCARGRRTSCWPTS